MRCPKCGADDDRVVDSRAADDGAAVRRRRECAGCAHRFTTFERVELAPIRVIKRGGRQAAWQLQKIIDGIRRAGNERLDETQVLSLAELVERRLRADHAGQSTIEVSSERIGLEVLQVLAEVDTVAYVRFASVYEDFQQPEDFAKAARTLRKSTEPISARATDDLVRFVTGTE